MTRIDDLGEEFTIKFVDDFCNVERSVGDTEAKGLSWYGIYPVYHQDVTLV